MSNLCKEDQLLSFIEKKKNNDTVVDSKKMFFIYTKAIRNSITKTYDKLKNYDNVIYCTEMINSIFWIIVNYTNNLKLTMFLCERAIILYIEYISLSNNLNSNEEINILDVKLFIFKKTLGPLKLNFNDESNNGTKQVILNIKNISKYMKNMQYKIFFLNYNNNIIIEDLENTLENICSLLSNIIYKLNSSNLINYIENLLYLDDNTTDKNMYNYINELKFKLEIYYYLHNNLKNKCNMKINNLYKKLIKDIPDFNNKLIDPELKFTENKIFLNIIKDIVI
tara:strand:+ start:711 stop:1553 length:843 start_codon:yes stop_codon:yes gene_type:complete